MEDRSPAGRRSRPPFPRSLMPIRPSRVRLALALLCAALLVPSTASAVPFSPVSVWNAPLSATAPLDAKSAAFVSELNRQVTAYKAWINTDTYSTPVYTVPASQPVVKIKLDVYAPALQTDFNAVPLPANAQPARGADAHLVVQQPATDTMWEFWAMYRAADGWHARWGGKMTSVSANRGYFPAAFGATATSLPLLGGLIRPDELSVRRIDHALAIGVNDVRAGTFTFPAQRTDGNLSSTASILEGTRFRLPATLNLDNLGLSPAAKAMAQAVKSYGMIVRDRAGCVCFYAEDSTPSGKWPYGALFGTNWMDGNNALRGFPWTSLQVVAAASTSA
jgi:hypothetical protein